MISDVLAMDDGCSGVLTDAPPSGTLAQPADTGVGDKRISQHQAVVRLFGYMIYDIYIISISLNNL